jgi:hypothetical protein
MKKIAYILAAGLILLGGSTARAQPQLDFDVPLAGNPTSSSNSISWNGNSSSNLVGSSIGIDYVQGLGTPSNPAGTLNVAGGELNFSSGAFTGTNTQNGVTTYNFGAGSSGSISIVGGISSLGITNSPSNPLLTGQIEGVQVTPYAGGLYTVSIAMFIDTVNSTLAGYFGLTGGSAPWSGNFNISFSSTTNTGFSDAGGVLWGGDVVTSPLTPEPSSLLLAGFGALGMLGFGLWRGRARHACAEA